MEFDSPDCVGSFRKDETNATILLSGSFKVPIDDSIVYYIAASPIDARHTFTGSGLPYATQDQAYYGTPNNGSFNLENNSFQFEISQPSSYYIDFNGTLVQPEVRLIYKSYGQRKETVVPLGEHIGYRSLTYQPARVELEEMFYECGWRLPVRTQEQVLRDSAYSQVERKDFWGLKPPQ